MKKSTALFLACMVSAAAFAQLPNGSLAPNFTATDLNGNTWNLYDILDQGKSVILNFSATWAGPDWDYHNTNVLQDFYELHGPDGDNTARVLWVEGDVTTNVNCITGGPGCTGGTQGDWTAGQTYPMIDDATGSVTAAYQIAYFPTIYLICSDKIIKEVGQLSLAQLESEASMCPVILGTSKLITGSVVKDDNANCIADSGETPLSNWMITATGQNNATVSTVSNSVGIYKLYVDSTYSPFILSFTPPNSWWSPCPAPPPLTFTVADTVVVNHAAEALISCPQLYTQIGTPFLRRCFQNNFHVEVCNNGTDTAVDAFVDVVLPPPEFLPPNTASLPFTVVSPGVYRFQLGDIEVGACAQFNVGVEVSCDSTEIGQTLCFEAHAYPDSLCDLPNSAWNGANVAVTATCQNGTPQFSIVNTGTAPMTEALNYIVIEDDVMYSEGVFQLNAGEALAVNLPNSGATWRVEALQVPDHPVEGNPSAALEGCTVSGNPSTGFVLGYPTYDPGPAHDRECMTIIGSWDPNDKTGFPLGVTSQNLIYKNTDLDYLIRFQNTGTDTAFQVVVRDTLSLQLIPRSIRLGASSHAYEFAIENENILVFRFKDIRLVDSFTNEPASHGFLRFKISQRNNLADGTEITNRAAIYFDFNPPVLTNTTLHRIGEIAHVSGVKSPESAPLLAVYPNPLNGSAWLYLKQDLPVGSTWLLYDFSGRLIGSGSLNGRAAFVGTGLKTVGLYRIEFRSKEGRPLGGATFGN